MTPANKVRKNTPRRQSNAERREKAARRSMVRGWCVAGMSLLFVGFSEGAPPQPTKARVSAVQAKPNFDAELLRKQVPANQPRFSGYVDLHTHPMAHLAFGGKLIHGGVDVGSLLPADADCNARVRATSMAHALGQDDPTHGGGDLFRNHCGDDIRKEVIRNLQVQKHAVDTPDRATGAEDFASWPRWDDITHQKMWIDWIRRAHAGGLRVMVALATNNKTLGDAVSGPGDAPTDDKGSGDLQIDETRAFVARHPDLMQIAQTPAELLRIVRAGKLAIVLGVELDTIGNLKGNVSRSAVTAELDRLYAKGIRYIFPIHVIDNAFGGTAVYEGAFNLSNYREFGQFWNLTCSGPTDEVTYTYTPPGFDAAVGFVKATKLGIDPLREPPRPPSCTKGTGHVNARGLTALGEFALLEMMKRGFLIDIDHMSHRSAERAIELADAVPGRYPLNSGHSGLRLAGAENARTTAQYNAIGRLGGIVGVGMEGQDAHEFAKNYGMAVVLAAGNPAGIGSDLNGLVRAPKPRRGSTIRYDAAFTRSRTGSKEWDYNRDGVAHYGLLSEFVKDMRTSLNGEMLVDEYLMRSGEQFLQVWEKCESRRSRVP